MSALLQSPPTFSMRQGSLDPLERQPSSGQPKPAPLLTQLEGANKAMALHPVLPTYGQLEVPVEGEIHLTALLAEGKHAQHELGKLLDSPDKPSSWRHPRTYPKPPQSPSLSPPLSPQRAAQASAYQASPVVRKMVKDKTLGDPAAAQAIRDAELAEAEFDALCKSEALLRASVALTGLPARERKPLTIELAQEVTNRLPSAAAQGLQRRPSAPLASAYPEQPTVQKRSQPCGLTPSLLAQRPQSPLSPACRASPNRTSDPKSILSGLADIPCSPPTKSKGRFNRLSSSGLKDGATSPFLSPRASPQNMSPMKSKYETDGRSLTEFTTDIFAHLGVSKGAKGNRLTEKDFEVNSKQAFLYDAKETLEEWEANWVHPQRLDPAYLSTLPRMPELADSPTPTRRAKTPPKHLLDPEGPVLSANCRPEERRVLEHQETPTLAVREASPDPEPSKEDSFLSSESDGEQPPELQPGGAKPKRHVKNNASLKQWVI